MRHVTPVTLPDSQIKIFDPVTHQTAPLSVTLTQHALGLLTMVGGGAIVLAFLLDLVGLPIRPWTVGPLLLLLIAAFGWNFWYQFRRGRYTHNGWHWAEFLLLTTVVGGFLLYGWWLGLPNELPVGTTVDAVHQYGVADYINQSGRLPIHALDQRPNLQDGLEYPPAFVILVSLLSQNTGLDVLSLMHPIVALMAAIAAGATFAIVSLLLRGKSWRLAGAGLAAGSIFLPYAYTFGSFISETYYAQVTAEALLMLSLFFLLTWRLQADTPTLVLFGLAVSALFIAYPTLALIPLGAFGVAVVFSKQVANGLSTKSNQANDAPATKYRRFLTLLAVYLPIGLLAILFLKDRWQTGLGTLGNEGEVLRPDLSRYSWPSVILAAVGLLTALFEQNVLPRLIALFCGLLVLEGVGLWLLKVLLDSGSYYAVFKLFYPAVYLWPILAIIGLDWLLSLLTKKIAPRPSRNWFGILNVLPGMGIFGAVLLTTWITHPQPAHALAPLTRPDVEVAHWMQSNLKLSEYNVGYNVTSGASAYWLQVGLFKQPRDVHSNDLLLGEPLSFEGWFYAPNSPQYLFTDDLPKLALDERCQVLYRNGNTAVLTRTQAYLQSLATRPSLAIQYKMELNGNVLSIKSEATMSAEIADWLGVGLEIAAEDGHEVYSLVVPAEKGRTKQQFLGVTVTLPKLGIKEFYSDNNFPSAPAPVTPLAAGRYSIFVVLQKAGITAERRKLLDFESDAVGHLSFDHAQHIITGQFLFEGEPAQPLPPLPPLDFKLAASQLRLTGLVLPDKAAVSSPVTVTTQWQNLTATTHNYRLQWVWLNATGETAGQTEALPQNGLYPTWLWSTSRPIIVKQSLKMPDQPGRYQLAFAFFDINTGEKSELLKTGSFITAT